LNAVPHFGLLLAEVRLHTGRSERRRSNAADRKNDANQNSGNASECPLLKHSLLVLHP
jgi:hypothetical protein